jgi:hypothetical protein
VEIIDNDGHEGALPLLSVAAVSNRGTPEESDDAERS